jgi:translation elongation factor EF-G
MLGYATTLRSMTQGEGSFSSEYFCHLPVDPQLAGMEEEKDVKDVKTEKTENV